MLGSIKGEWILAHLLAGILYLEEECFFLHMCISPQLACAIIITYPFAERQQSHCMNNSPSLWDCPIPAPEYYLSVITAHTSSSTEICYVSTTTSPVKTFPIVFSYGMIYHLTIGILKKLGPFCLLPT